jgi:hypothetical protein
MFLILESQSPNPDPKMEYIDWNFHFLQVECRNNPKLATDASHQIKSNLLFIKNLEFRRYLTCYGDSVIEFLMNKYVSWPRFPDFQKYIAFEYTLSCLWLTSFITNLLLQFLNIMCSDIYPRYKRMRKLYLCRFSWICSLNRYPNVTANNTGHCIMMLVSALTSDVFGKLAAFLASIP